VLGIAREKIECEADARRVMESFARTYPKTKIEFSAQELFAVLGAINLSLKYPENTGPQSLMIRGVVSRVAQLLDGMQPGMGQIVPMLFPALVKAESHEPKGGSDG
jgi:hypothetical protein